MKPTHRPPFRLLLAPACLAATLACAQTAIWRGPAATTPNSVADWANGAYWSTGTAPNGAAATVVIEDGILGDTTAPLRVGLGLDRPTVVELDGLRYDSAGGTDEARVFPQLRLAESFGSQTLRLTGAGITVPTLAPNAPRLFLGFGTTMEFTGSARISGLPPSSDKTGTGHAARITVENGGTLRFRDQSSSGTGALYIHPGARLEFSGTSSAGNTLIMAGGNHQRLSPDHLPLPDPAAPDSFISFRDGATLGGALIRTDGRVEFHDTASGGMGWLRSNGGETWFFGQSSAGSAIMDAGRTAIFMDQATAGNSRLFAASVEFRRQSTAGGASVGATTMRFSDNARGGTADLSATRLEVVDQADLSEARARAAVIDLSGAHNGGGTSARAGASGAAAGTTVADNAREVSIGFINSVGRIHLGSNSLVLKGGSLQGRISDAGGAYRDAQNRDYVGGGLIIDGAVNITNPDNDYTGPTILRGANAFLALNGGRITHLSIAQGQRLQGVGIVGGHLINNGTVNTNNGNAYPGRTLYVLQDYHQGITGNLQMLMTPALRDTLSVAGHASIAGGVLHFFGGSAFSQAETINFLTAGSFSGQWAAFSLPAVATGLAARVTYTATGAQLVIEAAPAPALKAAKADNLIVLTPMGYKDGGDVRTLFGLGHNAPVQTLVDAVAAHDPAAYGLLPAGSLLSALSRQQGAERQAAALRSAVPEHRLVLVSELNRREESLDPADLPSGRNRTDGFLASAFWRSGAFLASGTLGGENVHGRFGSGGGFDLDRLSPGLALRYGGDHAFATLGATWTREEYDLERPIEYAGTILLARATPRAGRLDASLLAGRAFRLGRWTLTPSAGLLWSRWSLRDFTEQGVPAGAAVLEGWRSEALLARAGLELKGRLLEGRLIPRLQAGWFRTVDSSRRLGARYSGATESFALPGLAPDREMFQAGLGLDWRLSSRLSTGLGASLIHGRHTAVTSDLSASLRWSF